jgi:hypothetical protein
MSRYDEIVLTAVSELAALALSCGVLPDENKIARIIARAMFGDITAALLDERAAEIRPVVESYVTLMRELETAVPA